TMPTSFQDPTSHICEHNHTEKLADCYPLQLRGNTYRANKNASPMYPAKETTEPEASVDHKRECWDTDMDLCLSSLQDFCDCRLGPLLLILGLQACPTAPGFHVDPRDSDSGLHVFKGNYNNLFSSELTGRIFAAETTKGALSSQLLERIIPVTVKRQSPPGSMTENRGPQYPARHPSHQTPHG
ncbi:hypothetical protein STEG23_011968, partial [Scotinomys teguina]